MTRVDEAQEAELELADSRRAAEQRLADLKSAVAAVSGSVGRVPRNATLWLLVMAAAGGFALASPLVFRRRRQRRRRS